MSSLRSFYNQYTEDLQENEEEKTSNNVSFVQNKDIKLNSVEENKTQPELNKPKQKRKKNEEPTIQSEICSCGGRLHKNGIHLVCQKCGLMKEQEISATGSCKIKMLNVNNHIFVHNEYEFIQMNNLMTTLQKCFSSDLQNNGQHGNLFVSTSLLKNTCHDYQEIVGEVIKNTGSRMIHRSSKLKRILAYLLMKRCEKEADIYCSKKTMSRIFNICMGGNYIYYAMNTLKQNGFNEEEYFTEKQTNDKTRFIKYNLEILKIDTSENFEFIETMYQKTEDMNLLINTLAKTTISAFIWILLQNKKPEITMTEFEKIVSTKKNSITKVLKTVKSNPQHYDLIMSKYKIIFDKVSFK